MKSTFLFTLAWIIFFCFVGEAQTTNETGKITGDVMINFREQKLSAKLRYDYLAVSEPEAEIKFHLSKNFKVKKVKCRLCRSFKTGPENERLPSLLIDLERPLAKGERLVVELEYDGSIADIYKAEHEFLELGLDNFWFPVHRSIGQFNFLYRIRVKTDETGYDLAGNGHISKKGKGWLVESKVPDYDIDLVLGRNLKVDSYRKDGSHLQVISKNLPPETPAGLLAGIREILEFYNSSIGTETD